VGYQGQLPLDVPSKNLATEWVGGCEGKHYTNNAQVHLISSYSAMRIFGIWSHVKRMRHKPKVNSVGAWGDKNCKL
jgi:hypothetical protein